MTAVPLAQSIDPGPAYTSGRGGGRRLTAADASFLVHEKTHPATSAEIAALLPMDAPVTGASLRQQLSERLPALPLLACTLQRSAWSALCRPVWEPVGTDPLDHVHELAGDEIASLCDTVLSEPLDRALPLWGIWILRDHAGRTALLYKAHHALHDGVSLARVLEVLLGEQERPVPCLPPAGRRLGLRDAARRASGLPQAAFAAARPARRLPVRSNGGGRRCGWVTTPTGSLLTARAALGGTVNDMYLTLVARALALWAEQEQLGLPRRPLAVLVPVNSRRAGEAGRIGNHLSLLTAALPAHGDLPAIHRAVRESTALAKRRGQAEGVAVLAAAQRFVPAALLPYAVRLNTSPRLFSFMASNVEGPSRTLGVAGARAAHVVGLNFLPAGHPLAFWLFTNAGEATISVVADEELDPSLAGLVLALQAALDELAAAAAPGANVSNSK